MWFSSKREILEHCGKDGKDIRWLDRAIKDGRVIKMEGDYCTVSDYIKELEESESNSIHTITKLREEIEELKKSESKPQVIVQEGDTAELKKELVEVRNNLTFQMGEYDRLQYKMDKALEKCYDLMVEKKVVVKEKNPLSSFIRWATDVDMSDIDEEIPI